MSSDEELMLGFQRGSEEAFRELFARYQDKIYGFFRRRLNDPTRAQDLTQDAFLAVLRAAQRYEPRSLFRTYLYGIAMNLLRAERRKPPCQAEDPPEPSFIPHSDEVLSVRQAIGQLDAEDREILLLREYEELSYAEISGLLRIPLNTVRSRLFRARMAMKELLAARRQGAGAPQ